MVKQVIEFIKNNKYKNFCHNKWTSSEDYTLYYSIKKDDGKYEYDVIYLEIEFEGLFGFSIKLEGKLLYKSHNFFEWYKLRRFIKKEYEVYVKNKLKAVEEIIVFLEDVDRNTTQENQ